VLRGIAAVCPFHLTGTVRWTAPWRPRVFTLDRTGVTSAGVWRRLQLADPTYIHVRLILNSHMIDACPHRDGKAGADMTARAAGCVAMAERPISTRLRVHDAAATLALAGGQPPAGHVDNITGTSRERQAGATSAAPPAPASPDRLQLQRQKRVHELDRNLANLKEQAQVRSSSSSKGHQGCML
jgi:hypothetical protein